jgi:hypothetical protein
MSSSTQIKGIFTPFSDQDIVTLLLHQKLDRHRDSRFIFHNQDFFWHIETLPFLGLTLMSPIKAAVTDNADPEDNGNFTLKTLLRQKALLFW